MGNSRAGVSLLPMNSIRHTWPTCTYHPPLQLLETELEGHLETELEGHYDAAGSRSDLKNSVWGD